MPTLKITWKITIAHLMRPQRGINLSARMTLKIMRIITWWYNRSWNCANAHHELCPVLDSPQNYLSGFCCHRSMLRIIPSQMAGIRRLPNFRKMRKPDKIAVKSILKAHAAPTSNIMLPHILMNTSSPLAMELGSTLAQQLYMGESYHLRLVPSCIYT